MHPTQEPIRISESAHFFSTQTEGRKPFFRQEPWARSLLSTVNQYDGVEYKLHAFVVMPDHLHMLITPFGAVERAVQTIKDEFSQRAKSELEWTRAIWERGFTDHRIHDEEDWLRHMEYIRVNPIEARLSAATVLYEFMGFPGREMPEGLKPLALSAADVRARARTLHN